MKKINCIIVMLLVLAFNIADAQVTTKIISVNVNNSTSYSNCDLIDLGTTNNNSFTFNYELKKLAGQAIGLSTLRIMFKYDNLTTASERIFTSILTNSWSNNTTSTGTITCNILQSEILVTGSSIYLEFTSDSGVLSKSCEYALKKTQQPVFNLVPTSTPVDCGSSEAKTFTVVNQYNSSGTKTYQWTYPGWSGTVNTSMSAVTLTPTSSTTLPGNVTVTTYLNGVAQPTRTSVVSRSAFTSNASISGSSAVCSSSTYTISGLLAGQSVTSWVVSNPSKATLSATSGNSTTVTKTGSGPITLTATITNSCNQTITKSIDLQLGIVNVPGSISGPASVLTGALVNYSVASVPGATSYIWWLPYPYDTFTNFNYSGQNWQKRTNYSSSRSIQVFSGLGGNPGQIQVMAVNACGTSGARKLSVTHGGGGGGIPRPAGTGTQIYPNPAKDFINIELSNQEITTNSDIRAIIYDTNGKELKSIKIISSSTTIGIEDIPSGMYIIEVNIDGEKESHKIYMN